MFGLPLIVFFGAACVGSALPLLWWSVAGERTNDSGMQERLRVSNDLREVMLARSGQDRMLRPGMATLASLARRLSPPALVERTDTKIKLAGLSRHWPLERALAMKLLLGAGGALIGLMRWAPDPGDTRLLITGLILAFGGFFLPDVFFTSRAQRRQDEIGRSLPDVLDQMTISVEAGLGFDAALAHVASTASGPLPEEITITLQETRLGMTRNQAFDNLLERTDVQDLRMFVKALQQAERLGVPIATVLRGQAKEMRTIRRQTAEENAQKVPVKMILPLVLLILPALVIVVLGPAILQILDTFS